VLDGIFQGPQDRLGIAPVGSQDQAPAILQQLNFGLQHFQDRIHSGPGFECRKVRSNQKRFSVEPPPASLGQNLQKSGTDPLPFGALSKSRKKDGVRIRQRSFGLQLLPEPGRGAGAKDNNRASSSFVPSGEIVLPPECRPQ